MWEPFTEEARRTIVRAQEVAQMFASSYIGTEHIAFALAENDDEVGRVLAGAIDRDQMREQLGGARNLPEPEMVFTTGAKRAIEKGFENARRLNHNYIGVAHIALGILDSGDQPPLRPGTELDAVRAELDVIAASDASTQAAWQLVVGDDPHPVTAGLLAVLRHFPKLRATGTRVIVTIVPPDGKPHSWTFTKIEGAD